MSTAASESVQTAGSILHFIFGALVLNFKQPHFRQGIWLGLIFIFLMALNLRVSRFWCRALCPLGALLGVGVALVGPRPLEKFRALQRLQPLPDALPGW